MAFLTRGAAGRPAAGQEGFTLIELLVIMLIIGILAAIAIPLLLGQKNRANDASAKSDLKAVVLMVEECRLETKTYTGCDEKDELGGAPGISWGGTSPGEGQAGVYSPITTDGGFYAYAVSKAKDDNSNRIFVWQRKPDNSVFRFCITARLPALSGNCEPATW